MTLTYRDLVRALNKLDDSQLDYNATIRVDDKFYTIKSIEFSDEEVEELQDGEHPFLAVNE